MRSLLDFYTAAQPSSPAMNVIVYQILLLACWAYALRRGGTPEKIGATILVIGSYLSYAAFRAHAAFPLTQSPGRDISFQSVEFGVLTIDVLCSIAFLALALRADRFWPMWVAALQVLGTASHAVKYIDPEILGRTYAFMLAVWSYPMILLMVIGTWRHRRRLTRFNADRSWSVS